MSETVNQRRRREFAAGMLDQLATILGGLGAAVLAAGGLGPVVAVFVGSLRSSPPLSAVVSAAFAAAASLLILAVVVKGSAKRLDDDAHR